MPRSCSKRFFGAEARKEKVQSFFLFFSAEKGDDEQERAYRRNCPIFFLAIGSIGSIHHRFPSGSRRKDPLRFSSRTRAARRFLGLRCQASPPTRTQAMVLTSRMPKRMKNTGAAIVYPEESPAILISSPYRQLEEGVSRGDFTEALLLLIPAEMWPVHCLSRPSPISLFRHDYPFRRFLASPLLHREGKDSESFF